MKRLAIWQIIAWCMLVGCENVSCASLKENERTIVKRDVDAFAAVATGALDVALGVMDQFRNGFAMHANSKTDLGKW